MKKATQILLFLTMALTIGITVLTSHWALAEADTGDQQAYISMAELRAQTPARWTETYETPWRSIEIDTPIEVPQVDKMPIVKISKGGTEVEADKLADYGYIVYNDALGIQAYTSRALDQEFDMTPTQGRKIAGEFYDGERPDVQPEDVSLSYEDALAICEKEIDRLWGLDPSQAFLKNVTAYDGVYALRRQNGQKLWGERADERTGCWGFSFEQLYHGISMESCNNGNAYDDYFFIDCAARPFINFCLWAEGAYCVSASIYKELEVVYEDVPLHTFEEAKAAIEQEIMDGHLRWIGKMKLCYIPYLDPSDDSIFWLLPTWYVEGIYTGSAAKDLQPIYDEENGILVGYAGGVNDNMVVVYEVNGGRLIDRRATHRGRRNVPEIITWSMVNQVE